MTNADSPPAAEKPTGPRFSLRARLAAAVLLLGLAAYAPKAVKESHNSDFERYYTAGCVAMRGGDIYRFRDDREFKYFPLFAQLMSPVAFVAESLGGDRAAAPTPGGLRLGAALWYVLLCGAYLGAVALATALAGAKGERAAGWIAGAALLLSCRFFVENIRLGQINMIVLFLAVLGVYAVARGRERLGGAAVALAAGIKFMPILLLLLFLRLRRWRAAAWTVLMTVAFVLLVPSLTWGWGGHLDLMKRYIRNRHQMVTGLPKQHAPGQSLPSLANRLLRRVNATALRREEPLHVNVLNLSPAAAGTAAALLSLLAVGLALWACGGEGARARHGFALQAGLFFLLMLLVSPESRKAHYVSTLVPTAALAAHALRAGGRRRLLPLGAALVLFLGSSSGLLGDGRLSAYANALGVLLLGGVILFAATIRALRSDNLSPSTQP